MHRPPIHDVHTPATTSQVDAVVAAFLFILDNLNVSPLQCNQEAPTDQEVINDCIVSTHVH